jgi:glycosyltransferase involved in cell wall biosynthesis
MKQKIHVMQIIDSLTFGGAEVLLRGLAAGLMLNDYCVRVCYSTPGPIAEEIRSMDIPVTRLPHLARVDPILLWRIFLEIRRHKPDIVHTHLFKSDFHGRLAARLAGVPVVISTVHNCHNWVKNPVLGVTYGLTARLADRIIAVSDEVQNHVVRYAHLDPAKVTIIPNAIPIEQFKSANGRGTAVRKELGIPMGVPVIGIVARLAVSKDHETFLRAAALVLQSIPNTLFLVVGDGPLRASLETMASVLGISHATIFCGIRKDIPAVYDAMDILVFSSLWEGLPVALLEGMAARLPVVATSVGGIPGVIKPDVSGLLVPSSNAEPLAQACIKLIKNPHLREKMGLAGQSHVQAHYSMNGMVEKTVDLYQSLLLNAGL